ncbi:hypothetical protein [Streptomyces sp. DW26H14]|uniref:hypothetical protein n=1 Tax=Streptomyces sp. DW26H14 TaxID=3435395 RepID=UPI00403D86BE
MKRATAFTAAAVVTLAVTAAGCSSNPQHAASPPRMSAPASSNSPAAPHYSSIGAITAKIRAAGLATTTPHKSTDDTYITEVGGQDYELTISEKAGQDISGSGIYLFPNTEAVTAWTTVSKSMGGIAVVGDTWAVSLPSGSEYRPITDRMAPTIAKALGGAVAR